MTLVDLLTDAGIALGVLSAITCGLLALAIMVELAHEVLEERQTRRALTAGSASGSECGSDASLRQ